MPKYHILALDGGSIRGVLTATLMEKISVAMPGWLEKVDLVAGTSTGGLLALGLAEGLTPSQLREMYVKQGPVIFQDSVWDDIKDVGRLLGAEYSTAPLRGVLTEVLGADTRLKNLGKRVLIPAFDLDNTDPDPHKRSWKAKFFHNYPGPDSDGEMKAVDVALYTSAAPTYFPTVDGFADGGVVANNPSMAALAQTQDARVQIEPRPALTEVVLLSLGTGNTLSYLKGDNLDWGLTQWAAPLIRILLNSPGGVVDYQCRQILGDNYFRLNPALPTDQTFELDDVSSIPRLIKVAQNFNLAGCGIFDWLKQYW
ncbi:MAG TPA: patatin-like phospholipase family protein [Chloroflexia bacterium]|nr:patatin-like phospholipase family protein [Chloroflexia bacterium]